MNLDELKAHLDRLFAQRPSGSTREQAGLLREALLEFRVAVDQLREGLARTEADLDRARRELVDYERRGRLAAEIADAETVRVAEEFVTKTRRRVDLLERKVIVQRDELLMAEREMEDTRERFRRASHGLPQVEPRRDGTDEDLGSAPDDPLLDRRAREAAVDAQLEMLKKKLGRE